MLAAAIHLMRGTPYIYQGEEIGMTNADFTNIHEYRDVESLNYHDILRKSGLTEEKTMKIIETRSRDNSRTPMQWAAGQEAGFTTGTPWLGVNRNHEKINAEQEEKDDSSILSFYKELIRLRKNLPVIAEGSIHFMERENDDVLAYERELGSEKMLVFCNFRPQEVSLHESLLTYAEEGWQKLLGNYPECRAQLRPYEVVVLKK